jgi:hypothetical protein
MIKYVQPGYRIRILIVSHPGSATLPKTAKTVKILALCLEIVPHPVQKLLARKLLPFLPKQENKLFKK